MAAATEVKNDQKKIQEFLNAIGCRVGTSQLNNALLKSFNAMKRRSTLKFDVNTDIIY